ncbi:MAG: hypothetical protein GWM92_09940, partial [Gemmatimonadetes bacterium]|nr:hypothetical protein [Gemmatimonadota bacterium]NIR78983.1 hypothetical protein [Gemmatimonadota bacterium]NIT87632.1 hypothetical protein [Gemmatimonadota bacterium]NIU31494.1 hypothetical protein [Gemmatimonadota bacterium]NIU38023.1 hypothetical protein [Gemmatimonadota bacterium]
MTDRDPSSSDAGPSPGERSGPASGGRPGGAPAQAVAGAFEDPLIRRIGAGWFGRLLLPGIILQSVLIGGGYATGREIVAYGAKFGAAGWLAIVAIFLGFGVTAFFTFEVARIHRAFDYKTFIKLLIGKGWPAFDLLYASMTVVVIAVMASAAANILQDTLGVPPLAGTAGIVVAVGVLTYHGAAVIEAFKSVGTGLLYGAYLLFAGLVLGARWDRVQEVFATADTSYLPEVTTAAVLGTGIVYVGYNLACYPTTLFTLHRHTTRRESAIGALIAGLLMTVPFALSYLALLAFYPDPEIMGAPVPWLPMLRSVGGPVILGVFGIVMGWTLLETSVGMIHAILDRIDKDLETLDTGPLADVHGLTRLQSGLLG